MSKARATVGILVPVKGALLVSFKPETTDVHIRAILHSLKGYCDCRRHDIGPCVISVPFGTEDAALTTLRAQPLVILARQATELGKKEVVS